MSLIEQVSTCTEVSYDKVEPEKNIFTFDFVNFSNLPDTNTTQAIKKYDKVTTETYCVKRRLEKCAITGDNIIESCKFKFKYMWNPLNGERICIDRVGPLYFNVITLYNHYFNNRFTGLWTPSTYDPVSKQSYEGYYGDLVGAGKNIKINSRGYHPDKYLFRLPIQDCYLYEDHNHSIVTMGPLLTDEEISEIDVLLLKLPQQYKLQYKLQSSITLTALKAMYDNALEENPSSEKISTWVNNIYNNKNQLINDVCKWWKNSNGNEEYKNHLNYLMIKEFYNRSYVDKLIKHHL
jgi:hypothetical protein